MGMKRILTWLMSDGITVTYDQLTAGPGIIVSNGGPWNCNGLQGSCSQSGKDSNSPITSSMDSTLYSSTLVLWANIDFTNGQYNGVTSAQFTFGYDAMTTWGGGSSTPPDQPSIWSLIGPPGVPSNSFMDTITYGTGSWTSVRHTGSINYKLGVLQARLNANVWTSNHPASVSIRGVFFQISNVVYGAISTSSASPNVGTTPAQGTISLLSTPTTASSGSSSTSLNLASLALPSISLTGAIVDNGVTLTMVQHSPDPSASTVSNISSTQSSISASDTIAIIVSCVVGILVLLMLVGFLLWRGRRRNKLAATIEAVYPADNKVVPIPEEEIPPEAPPYRKIDLMMQRPVESSLLFSQ